MSILQIGILVYAIGLVLCFLLVRYNAIKRQEKLGGVDLFITLTPIANIAYAIELIIRLLVNRSDLTKDDIFDRIFLVKRKR